MDAGAAGKGAAGSPGQPCLPACWDHRIMGERCTLLALLGLLPHLTASIFGLGSSIFSETAWPTSSAPRDHPAPFYVFFAGFPGIQGPAGAPGAPGISLPSLIVGLPGDPGRPGLDGERGKAEQWALVSQQSLGLQQQPLATHLHLCLPCSYLYP